MKLRAVATASSMAGLILIASCGAGGGVQDVIGANIAFATIGVGGGTAASIDGDLKLIVPPGALPGDKTITITVFSAAALPAGVAAVNPVKGFVIGPPDLVFNMPVKVQLGTDAFPSSDFSPNGDGADGTAGQFTNFDILISNGQLLPAQTLSYKEGDAMGVLEGDITGATTLISANIEGTPGFDFAGSFSDPVQVGTPGIVTGFVDVPGIAISPGTSQQSQAFWGLEPVGGSPVSFSIPGGFATPFASSTPLVSGMDASLVDSASINCGAVGTFDFQVNFRLQFFDFNNFFTQRNGATLVGNVNTYDLKVQTSLTCDPSSSPVSIVSNVALAGMDGTRLVPQAYPLPSGTTGGPFVSIAHNDGAAIVDALTGQIVYDVPMVTSGGYFEVAAMPTPAGNFGNPALIASGGSGWAVQDIDPMTGLPTGSAFIDPVQNLLFDFFVSDGINERGGFMVDSFQEVLLPVTFPQINWSVSSGGSPFGIPLASGASSSASTNQLVTSFGTFGDDSSDGGTISGGDLFFINNASPTAPQVTFIATIGNEPVQMRYDGISDVGAITDFIDDSLTIVLWDGVNPPTVTDQIFGVASGPFSLDVLGQRIVCAGRIADAITLAQVDTLGQIVSAFTVPMPAGVSGVTGVTFLRDAQNSVLVVCGGSGHIVVFPNLF